MCTFGGNIAVAGRMRWDPLYGLGEVSGSVGRRLIPVR